MTVPDPGGWQEVRLGDVIELKRGYDLPYQDRRPGSAPIVSSSGITGFHNEPMVRGPGVVTGRYGTLGEVFYVDQDFWPLNTTLYVRDFKGNDPRFISYFLKQLDFLAYSDKAAVPGLNRNHLHEARVNLPASVDQQLRIAHVLGTLDDKIELNKRMCATLEEMARAIFRSWFVDFDPVRAKVAAIAEGRDPERAAMAAISGKKEEDLDTLAPETLASLRATATLFPSSFTDSELGEIPEGWCIKSIGECCQVVGGSTPSTKEPKFWDGDICWATPRDMSRLSVAILSDTERKITWEGLQTISSGLLPVGTVLMSSRAPIGYLAISAVPVAINQGFIAMKPSLLSSAFLLLWAERNMDQVKSQANGSTFLEISKSNFRPIKLAVPEVTLLKSFDSIASPIYQQIECLHQQSITLAALRDTLLPKLLSGELSVGGAERADR